MFTFTKPTTTKSIRKNKQKASRRAREKEYWEEWRRNWDLRRNRLWLTFRIWSGKENLTLDEFPDWRPTRWVDVAKGKRATIPDFIMRSHIHNLKKVMHCLSLKDIAFDFYNEIIEWGHKEYEKKKLRQKQMEKDEKKYKEYLDWEIETRRRKKSKSQKVKKKTTLK